MNGKPTGGFWWAALLALGCAPAPRVAGSEALGGSSDGGAVSAVGTGGGGSSSGKPGAGAASGQAGQAAGGSGGGGASAGSGGALLEPGDAAGLAKKMGIGTNIGNSLDNTTAWETGWGQPLITRAFIDGVASRGIKTVRVPVAWDTYATNGKVDPAKLERVKEVVGFIHDAGMYSIVNIHWDGGWIFNEKNASKFELTEDVKLKFASYWTQLAQGFAGVGSQLVFEGLNEEARFYTDGDETKPPNYAAVNELNQLFVSTVRAQGGSNAARTLLIAGFHTDIDLTCVDAFQVPQDPAGSGRLLLSIHYYAPFPFVLLDSVETWASPVTTWGTPAEKQALQAQFSKLASFSAARHIPVVLGEFGVTRGEKFPRQPESRIGWMEAVASAALTRGMVPVLWDTGSEIARLDGAFSAEFQAVMDRVR